MSTLHQLLGKFIILAKNVVDLSPNNTILLITILTCLMTEFLLPLSNMKIYLVCIRFWVKGRFNLER